MTDAVGGTSVHYLPVAQRTAGLCIEFDGPSLQKVRNCARRKCSSGQLTALSSGRILNPLARAPWRSVRAFILESLSNCRHGEHTSSNPPYDLSYSASRGGSETRPIPPKVATPVSWKSLTKIMPVASVIHLGLWNPCPCLRGPVGVIEDRQ